MAGPFLFRPQFLLLDMHSGQHMVQAVEFQVISELLHRVLAPSELMVSLALQQMRTLAEPQNEYIAAPLIGWCKALAQQITAD